MPTGDPGILLLVPTTPDRAFLRVLKTYLTWVFGENLRIEVRTDARGRRRCRYQLSGEWTRPLEVYDILVQLFSSYGSEPIHDQPPS